MATPISIKLIEDTARELMARAAIDIPADYREGVRQARAISSRAVSSMSLIEIGMAMLTPLA